MATAIVKSSTLIKTSTSVVRQHRDACERAGEIYMAGLERLKSEYFDRITRATEILTGIEHTESETVPPAPTNLQAESVAAN